MSFIELFELGMNVGYRVTDNVVQSSTRAQRGKDTLSFSGLLCAQTQSRNLSPQILCLSYFDRLCY